MKYSDQIVDWLIELGYTHCFFVAGGNIMHLLDAVRERMTCIAVIHEVAAGIAAETFNEARNPNSRAFAMVTAGPGLTNIVTAIAGAWLESRELLILGGQVKSSDLANGAVRQRGIQEVPGTSIVDPICVASRQIAAPIPQQEFVELVMRGRTGRKGPVFIEICLDAQGAFYSEPPNGPSPLGDARIKEWTENARESSVRVAAMVRSAERPVFLIGGGVHRETARALAEDIRSAPVAVMTTWNGADRAGSDWSNYFGRPNQWGQRYANVLIQQADVIVALGTRLGMQQTGFNWQAFGANARIVQFDIDSSELQKGHPVVEFPIAGDANVALRELLALDLGIHEPWLDYCRFVRAQLPLQEPVNAASAPYIDPYRFVAQLSETARGDDVIIPCSSGGAFTTTMQAFEQKFGQIIITNKGLAAMGYGLGAAIGAAFAHPEKRTILIEGDGGFSQNLQELATVLVNNLNMKMFILSNEGYASIRMTQRNYFGGQYMGCDTRTGLGFPNWAKLFEAYSIPVKILDENGLDAPARHALHDEGPTAFIVPIDPEQTYFPKISSRVTSTGGMESAPLHLMSPDPPAELAEAIFRFVR